MSAAQAFWNTVGRREIALSEQFLFFLQGFLAMWRTFNIIIKFKIVVCKRFQFWRI